MNTITLSGTVKFPPRTFGSGNVGLVVQPDGETSGVDVTCWAEDAAEAAQALAQLGEGDRVAIVGKLVRKKDKMLGVVKDGKLVPGKDAWVLGVNVVSVEGVEAGPTVDDF